ncbi:MAG: hypothetical protein GY859_30085 [Desulfobacterales bacterium]|nr:hypothetical protein [Desulfobacterales bacterium]
MEVEKMNTAYLSLVGENLAASARMIGLTRLAGLSRVLGRAAGAAGIAYAVYEAGTFAISRSPDNPARKKLNEFREEREKWQGMISCLGRDPYEDGKIGSIDDGGAINALYTKINYGGQQIPPEKEEAQTLVDRFSELLNKTINLTGFDEFDEGTKELEAKLKDLKESLHRERENFADVQMEMSTIVSLIKPIESFYMAKEYELSQNAKSI